MYTKPINHFFLFVFHFHMQWVHPTLNRVTTYNVGAMPNATMGTMATMYSKEYTETNTRVYVHKDSEAQIVCQT